MLRDELRFREVTRSEVWRVILGREQSVSVSNDYSRVQSLASFLLDICCVDNYPLFVVVYLYCISKGTD